MGNQVATQARWTINSTSQGSTRLRRVKDSSEKSEGKREGVNAMGEDVPVGTRKKPGARMISLNVIDEQGDPEIDWEALEESGEWFSMTKAIVGGKRWQHPECQVSSVDATNNDDGEHMKTVEIISLRRKRL
jgi:hypothetical protein